MKLKPMATYNILLAADIKYIPYCFVTCQSVIDSLGRGFNPSLTAKNNISPEDSIIFTLALDNSIDLNELNIKCQNFIKRNSSIIDITFNLTIIDNSLFDGAPKLGQSFSTYYRVVIDRIYDSTVDYVLYLDCDLLVRKDIRELFQIAKSSDAVLSGVVDHAAEPFKPGTDFAILPPLQRKYKPIAIPLDSYMNAGILVFNLIKYSEQNISKSCLELIHTHRLKFHDQDLLNVIVKDKFCLDIEWNFQDRFYFNQFSSKTGKFSVFPYISPASRRDALDSLPSADDFVNALNEPAICHFTGFKPWKSFVYIPKTIPSKALSDRIQEWFSTAAKVEEFSSELESLKFSDLHNFDFTTCVFSNQISYYNYRNNKKRKNDKKVILGIVFILFLLQVLTMFLLILK